MWWISILSKAMEVKIQKLWRVKHMAGDHHGQLLVAIMSMSKVLRVS